MPSRTIGLMAGCASIALLAATLGAIPAGAATYIVPAGTSSGSAVTLTGTDQLTVQGAGSLAVDGGAVTLSGASTGIVIDNSGTVSATGRAIDTKGSSTTRTVTLINRAGATITSENDAFRLNTDITAGSVSVDNSGTIVSTDGGQAIDFDSISSGTASVVIKNNAGGVIRALDADGVRPGENGIVINAGTIESQSFDADPSNDGVDLQGHTASITNETGGLISGARHGITSDVGLNVTNEKGATIIGRNGSGVGSDGTGRVVNYGTITGAIDSISENGDGDGVDIDNTASITNYGTIQGVGAKGSKDGSANTSEGIAAGGGTIANLGTASLISGADNGILIDDSNGGNAFAATNLVSEGTIEGRNGYAVRFIGTQNDSVVTSGLISGASGLALDMGGGDDMLMVQNGGRFSGAVDMGAGNDHVILADAGSFAGAANAEHLNISGNATLTGTQAYSGDVTASGATVSFADVLDKSSAAALLTTGTLSLADTVLKVTVDMTGLKLGDTLSVIAYADLGSLKNTVVDILKVGANAAGYDVVAAFKASGLQLTVTPIPGALVLLAPALFGLGLASRRRTDAKGA